MNRFFHPLLAALLMGSSSLLYLATAQLSTAQANPDDAVPTLSILDSPPEVLSPNTTQGPVEVYRYHGLNAAEGPEASDGIYQDFSLDSPTVGKLWADPDAKSHDGEALSWVQAHVNRSASMPYLTVDFARHGYGTNVSIVPKNLVPEILPETAQISFEVRSQDPVCLGIRFMDRDGELWAYGTAPLNYKRLCIEPDQDWTKVTVPLTPHHPDWFKFEHSGNVALGNQVMDANLMAGLEFELGLVGDDYFSPGTASLDLRDINVEERTDPQT